MNTIYVVAPALTVRTSPSADLFLETLNRVLGEFNSVSVLRTASTLRATNPDGSDVVIFFNRPDADYEAIPVHFLEKSKKAGATILPVAATKEERHPPKCVEECQSFDIVEHLRQRALHPDQVATVANVFARQVLSSLRPTFSAEPMHLFLSHRRFDGEEITASFHRTLLTTAQKAFRDLFDVRVGEDAQEIIDTRLRESDAVIFLDTPRSGESPWIAKELQTALSLQLPIVWVRIGPEERRAPLSVLPSGVPHFKLPDVDPANGEVSLNNVEAIVQKAFEIHHRDYVDRLLDEFSKLKEIAHANHFQLTLLDPRRMIYSLALPRRAERYRERPLTHLLQLFGRTPTVQDIRAFPGYAREAGYELHPKYGAHYDSAILLAAVPSKSTAHFDDLGVHSDSIADYVNQIQRVTAPRTVATKRLVISGAFADCEPEFQQNMTNAVHAVTEAALRLGIGVTFGAHPTFQFMIFDMAKRLRAGDYATAIRMYVSRFFVTNPTIEEFRSHAEIRPTEAIAGDRAASLTKMREAMMRDPENSALVVIGGKTARGGHVPGVDEEIVLAREAGMPVFVLGSVGGRSSEVIAAMDSNARRALNGLPDDVQDEFVNSLDYAKLAGIVLRSAF